MNEKVVRVGNKFSVKLLAWLAVANRRVNSGDDNRSAVGSLDNDWLVQRDRFCGERVRRGHGAASGFRRATGEVLQPLRLKLVQLQTVHALIVGGYIVGRVPLV